jgi:hypothetical protein
MKTLDNERYGMIRLFEACISSLALLVEQDAQLFSWRRGRLAVCHRLAYHLEHLVFSPESLGKSEGRYMDLCAAIPGDSRLITPDILLHNRSLEAPVRDMAIVCREGYLSEAELKALHELKVKADCELTLAIAFLPQKEYLLIYRADDTRIDYYHFNRSDFHCHLLKRRDVLELSDDSHQLKLGMKVRR